MRGGYALCFLGGGEKMHAVLLEKERVAVKMRHAVLKGDLVVLERFRKAGAAHLEMLSLSVQYARKRAAGLGLLCMSRSSAGVQTRSAALPRTRRGYSASMPTFFRDTAQQTMPFVWLRLIWGMFSPFKYGLPSGVFSTTGDAMPHSSFKTRYKSA